MCRAVEPRWFAVEVERERELRGRGTPIWVERIEIRMPRVRRRLGLTDPSVEPAVVGVPREARARSAR